MTSNSQTPSSWKLRSSFSLLLHLASLVVLIVCVYCIIVLFRDLRQLEALVKEKTVLVELGKSKHTFPKETRKRRSPEAYEEYNQDRSVRESSGKRMAPDNAERVNLSGTKLTIVTKDDERLLLQTADGSPWALLPSLTRISVRNCKFKNNFQEPALILQLSTLEDFCFTAHQYCANKQQSIRPVSARQGSTGLIFTFVLEKCLKFFVD